MGGDPFAGFPYDVHAFDEVAPILAQAGARVVVPYTRGFGPTRFLSDETPRNGQQAARGRDILMLIDALKLERPILGGFDWGGNASCVVAALWPERIGGLVSYAGYDIIDVNGQRNPTAPALEKVFWYQHLFQTERGRKCLSQHRRDLCKILWNEWSPDWRFDDTTFARSADAFENPDFVDVVISCYRHSFGLEAGEAAFQDLEASLAQKPRITVPAITIDGTNDPLKPEGTSDHSKMFAGFHEHRVVDAGHNMPQEQPVPFASAVIRIREQII
ncbi:alpha/beta hydrolase [Rhizobium sp. P28RR-XV]|uniref:alpha/beta fold hydrolase n=1 Tax=Rhizobium sp. P28RR-XV TaxID=2726737 RepID=UPI0028A961A9|nr:alpha/beta hydrolase [Rhizobium sp. P28RR-XV]